MISGILDDTAFLTVYLVYTVATVVRRRSVSGTRTRYRMATLERALEWPCLVVVMIWFTGDVHDHRWVALAGDLLGLNYVITSMKSRRHDGDDDWFKDAAKRLRRRLRGWAAGLGPRTAPSPA